MIGQRVGACSMADGGIKFKKTKWQYLSVDKTTKFQNSRTNLEYVVMKIDYSVDENIYGKKI